jgi:hypothetical protein
VIGSRANYTYGVIGSSRKPPMALTATMPANRASPLEIKHLHNKP